MDSVALAVSVCASAVALAALGHRVVTQLMGRIDALGSGLKADMAHQFDESERHRAEAATAYRAAWDARHQALQDRVAAQAAEIADLRRQAEADRTALADAYVSRATWLEHVGSLNIKLDKLAEKLSAAKQVL